MILNILYPCPPSFGTIWVFGKVLKDTNWSFRDANSVAPGCTLPDLRAPSAVPLKKSGLPPKGRELVYSWVTYRNSPHPSFKSPYSVVLVELDEGVRLVSNMTGVKPEEIYIGMPVEVVFDDISENLTLPKFRKVG